MDKKDFVNGQEAKLEKTPVWEDAVIILSILTLWPMILRRENILSRIVMVAALVVLGFIFIRRFKRINSVSKKVDK